jgi:Protein of unknown function (DUF3618)
MADSETELANLPPDTLVTEIDRTRQDLARTIDAISDRLSPASITRRGVARIREQVSQIDPRIAGAAAAVVVTGVAAYLWWRRKR